MSKKLHPKVSIVIPVHNKREYTIECLEFLKKLTYPNYEIIVVDNGSTDGTLKILREGFPYIDVIENKRNLGYGEGCNVGIRFALNNNAKYVFLLSNDTKVVHENLLDELVRAAEFNPKIGIIGPKVCDYDDPTNAQFSGAKRDSAGIQDLSGCAFLVKSNVFRNIGIIDSVYFAFFEDRDFFIRAKKFGYQLRFVPTVKILHKKSATAGRLSYLSLYYHNRNRFLFAKRYLSLSEFFYMMFFTYFTVNHGWMFKELLINKKLKELIGYVKGIWDGLKIALNPPDLPQPP